MIDTSQEQFDHYVKNANFSFNSGMCTNERNRRQQIVDSSSSAIFPLPTELSCNTGTFVGSSWSLIQHNMVDRFIIREVAGGEDDFEIKAGVAGFPADAQNFNVFWTYVGPVFAFLLFVSFIYPFYNILKQIVEEKELKLTEGMKMMGASNFAIMTSWWTVFIFQFGVLAIVLMGAGGVSWSSCGGESAKKHPF